MFTCLVALAGLSYLKIENPKWESINSVIFFDILFVPVLFLHCMTFVCRYDVRSLFSNQPIFIKCSILGWFRPLAKFARYCVLEWDSHILHHSVAHLHSEFLNRSIFAHQFKCRYFCLSALANLLEITFTRTTLFFFATIPLFFTLGKVYIVRASCSTSNSQCNRISGSLWNRHFIIRSLAVYSTTLLG